MGNGWEDDDSSHLYKTLIGRQKPLEMATQRPGAVQTGDIEPVYELIRRAGKLKSTKKIIIPALKTQ
jgi:hypothetical protein